MLPNNTEQKEAIYMAFAVSLQAYNEHKHYLAMGCPKRTAAEEVENVEGLRDRTITSLRSDPLFYKTVQHALMMATEYGEEEELLRAEEERRKFETYRNLYAYATAMPLDNFSKDLIDQANAERRKAETNNGE